MRVIPVIDLMKRLVVRGVAGRRDEYRPIQSPLCDDPSPLAVARALVERFAFQELYLADLDAIAGAEPAWDVYAQLADCGLDLWVDAGLSGPSSAKRLAEWTTSNRPLAAVIAGLESLPDAGALRAMVERVGPERLVFSLDLKAAAPLTMAPAWREHDADAIASLAGEAGVRRLIVLDLSRVGTGTGAGTESLCRRLRRLDADWEITAGGGVRGRADIAALADAGCDAALVASALHDGRLTPDDMAEFVRIPNVSAKRASACGTARSC
ncbi:MAG TPA: HisA/HisF-related TIM barrel protein [Pirellulales bacterium]|nr:HisA/HisF-related TIM barrel protein [Pirellulales bacterium]